jgi:DNA-binding NtrC family response regulator
MREKQQTSTRIRRHTVERDIECAISSDANVLISGGDSRARASLAYLLYQRSRRNGEPFVVVDGRRSSAIHEGCEPPWGSVLFIEEVGDLSPRMQTELMLFLDRVARRDAQSTGREARDRRRTRIIATMAEDMLERIASKAFRAELFYRLNTINVVIPRGRDLGLTKGSVN